MESHQLKDSDNCYLDPTSSNYDIASDFRHDSGIGSSASLGTSNAAFTPQSEMESSFSDEQKLSTNKAYHPTTMPTRPANTGSTKELGLTPPPGNVWLPLNQSHSADGVIGAYPQFSANYVQPSILQQRHLHPSLQSLASPELTPEEQQLLLNYRQGKLMKNSNRLSVTPEGDGPNLYEELPGSLYKTHQQMNKLGQSPTDVQGPPHIPPISSMPSNSHASGLDTMNETSTFNNNQQRTTKENPLYESNDPANVKDTQSTNQKTLPDQSHISHISKQQYRCCCVFLFVSVVLATAALLIALLTATGIVNMNVAQNSNSTDWPKYGAVKGNQINFSDSPVLSQVQDLQTRVNELLLRVEGQSEVIDQLNVKVVDMENERNGLEMLLNKTSKELSSLSQQNTEQHAEYNNSLFTIGQLMTELTFVNSSLHQAINNVSKMAGPQGEVGPPGPMGLLDPSLCSYQAKSGVTDLQVGGSSFSSSFTDTDQEKLIAASCEWENFKIGILIKDNPGGANRYSCHCKSALMAGELTCKMHVWKCKL